MLWHNYTYIYFGSYSHLLSLFWFWVFFNFHAFAFKLYFQVKKIDSLKVCTSLCDILICNKEFIISLQSFLKMSRNKSNAKEIINLFSYGSWKLPLILIFSLSFLICLNLSQHHNSLKIFHVVFSFSTWFSVQKYLF